MKRVFPKPLKLLIFLVLLLIVFVGAFKIYYEYKADFRLSNIQYEETSFKPKVLENGNIANLDQIKSILNQPFHFLGKGNQSYAFESTDSKYVLKFFKFGHLKKSIVWNFLPTLPFLTSYLNEKNKSQEKRFFKVFEGYKIAYMDDPENTAMIYIHLNKTDNLNQSVLLTDKFGLIHTIDLDSVVFVIQEKVNPTKDVLTDLLQKGDVNAAKLRIGELFSLYFSQYDKGIYDRDHNLIYNTGFKDHVAIRLDVGKLRKDSQVKSYEFQKHDIEKIAFKRIDRFIKLYHPTYRNEIALFMKTELQARLKSKEIDEK